MHRSVKVTFGIEGLDEAIGGLPGHIFNIVETPDHQSGLLMLGHFLKAGLKKGERCTLITLEDPLALFQSFSAWNFDFYDYLKTEQLSYLFYQPSVTNEIGMTNDYSSLIDELERLSGGVPERVAFHQVDSILNLHSHMLINNCVQKLMVASASSSITYLGQYVQLGSRVHQDIRVAFLKNAPGFLTLSSLQKSHEGSLFRLHLDRVPWFHGGNEEYCLKLEPGHGLTLTTFDNFDNKRNRVSSVA